MRNLSLFRYNTIFLNATAGHFIAIDDQISAYLKTVHLGERLKHLRIGQMQHPLIPICNDLTLRHLKSLGTMIVFIYLLTVFAQSFINSKVSGRPQLTFRIPFRRLKVVINLALSG